MSKGDNQHDRAKAGLGDGRGVLITAGPTHEPIDRVRYIGNRSSGRLGVALANEAARRGWRATLLLGPTCLSCDDSRVRVVRFRTTQELERLLGEEVTQHDVLIMAAAVADYRPARGQAPGKMRRAETGEGVSLELEPTPDLLAGVAKRRKKEGRVDGGGWGRLLVGFALEPREGLEEVAAAKLKRKGVDLIVANPLETMDAEEIEAVLIGEDGVVGRTEGVVSKDAFAGWLMGMVEERV